MLFYCFKRERVRGLRTMFIRTNSFIAQTIALALLVGTVGYQINMVADAGQSEEAATFFKELATQTANPTIAAMAKENLKQLEKKDTRHRFSKKQIEVPLMTQNSGSLVVPTVLDGHVMGTFIVDTGASHTVITPRMAKKLKVEITSETPVISIVTANGIVKAPKVMLDSVTIGDVTVNNVEVIVKDLGGDILLGGLLGMNFFENMELTVKRDKLVLGID